MNRERTEVCGVYALLGGDRVDDWHAWPSRKRKRQSGYETQGDQRRV